MLSSSAPRLAAAASSHSVGTSVHGDIGTPVAENWCYTQVCERCFHMIILSNLLQTFFESCYPV